MIIYINKYFFFRLIINTHPEHWKYTIIIFLYISKSVYCILNYRTSMTFIMK